MDKNLRLIILLLALFCKSVLMSFWDCKPPGDRKCKFLNGYERPQWVTCRSESDIKMSSNFEYDCGLIADYCYYQCMLEKYDKEKGPVFGDCECSTTTLPDWCFSLSKVNCSWYSHCFKQRHPCRSNHYNGYAVEFAEKLCYTVLNKVTSTALDWKYAVQQCLEEKLLPILDITTSCEQIRESAVQTQELCFTEPYQGGHSICDLDLEDWTKVFWAIKGRFVDSTIPSLKNMIDVTIKCPGSVLQDVLNFESDSTESGMRLIKITLQRTMMRKRSVSSEYGETANNLVQQLAQHQRWVSIGVLWFSFVSTSQDISEISINILLASEAMYHTDAFFPPNADMNKTVHDLADALSNKQVPLNVERYMRVTEFRICLDFGCHETYGNVRIIDNGHTNRAAVMPLYVFLASIMFCLSLII